MLLLKQWYRQTEWATHKNRYVLGAKIWIFVHYGEQVNPIFAYGNIFPPAAQSFQTSCSCWDLEIPVVIKRVVWVTATNCSQYDERFIFWRLISRGVCIYQLLRTDTARPLLEIYHQLETIRTVVYLSQSLCNRNAFKIANVVGMCSAGDIYSRSVALSGRTVLYVFPRNAVFRLFLYSWSVNSVFKL